MSKLFYRYFPIFALLLVSISFAVWALNWQMAKPEQMQKMITRMDYMDAPEGTHPLQMRGIPGRYDFDFASITHQTSEYSFETGDFEFLTYSTRPHMAIIGFKDKFQLSWQGDEFAIEAHPLRASLQFDDDERLQSYIFEGKNGMIQSNEVNAKFSHLVFAYDPSHEEPYAMRLETSDANEIVLTAEDFNALMTSLLDDYLQ